MITHMQLTKMKYIYRRKEQWTHERTQRVENEVAPSVPNSQRSGPFTRIKDIPLSNRDVARHEVVARVVDFFPLNLCDASQQRCRLCKTKWVTPSLAHSELISMA